MLQEIISAFIESEHGSAVSQQFDDTFDGAEGFDEQYENALKYILKSCEKLIRADVLKDGNNELSEYIENLADYLQKECA